MFYKKKSLRNIHRINRPHHDDYAVETVGKKKHQPCA